MEKSTFDQIQSWAMSREEDIRAAAASHTGSQNSHQRTPLSPIDPKLLQDTHARDSDDPCSASVSTILCKQLQRRLADSQLRLYTTTTTGRITQTVNRQFRTQESWL